MTAGQPGGAGGGAGAGRNAGAGGDAGGPAGAALPRRVDKPWGHELIWAVADRYVGKRIAIDAGRRLSLQFHQVKDEWIHVLSGRLLLTLEDATGTLAERELGAGDSAHIPVGKRHRFAALEACELIEVSTPELDDVVRLADDFGREGTSAP